MDTVTVFSGRRRRRYDNIFIAYETPLALAAVVPVSSVTKTVPICRHRPVGRLYRVAFSQETKAPGKPSSSSSSSGLTFFGGEGDRLRV